MSDVVIKVENLSKQYRLGNVGTGTLSHDLNRWWHRVRGKDDPYIKVTESNDRTKNSLNSRFHTDADYVWALRDINFEVKRGEVLGIIGRNGAGKSTLLKILSRVTAPTEGCVKVKGRIGALLEVGTGFHPELTGRENIYLNGAILGMTKVEITARLDEIVDFSGCERYLDTPVKRYSSGMLVRLAFSVAAHLDPEILIVDEVLAVGDAEFQKKCIGKMQNIAGHGRTVLFVSHNMAAVRSLCTSGLLMVDGCFDRYGCVDDVVEYYHGLVQNNNNQALHERSDRYGSGQVKFIDFKVISDDSSQFVKSHQPVTFEVTLRASGGHSVENVTIAIQLVASTGVILTTYYTGFIGQAFTIKTSTTSVQCSISSVPLTPGTYYVHLWAGMPSGTADHIEYASRINVVEGDNFPFTKLADTKVHGHFIFSHKWSIGAHQHMVDN